MRLVSKTCILLVAILAVTGCGGPDTGQIIGSWTMKEKPQTWEFKSDGTLLMDGTVGSINMKQEGTYTIDGNKLNLNLSGKSKATSNDPKDKMTVITVNTTPANPKQETWDLTWQSPDEFTITLSTVVPAMTNTFNRKKS